MTGQQTPEDPPISFFDAIQGAMAYSSFTVAAFIEELRQRGFLLFVCQGSSFHNGPCNSKLDICQL
jgi:hypothetical protein